MIKPGLNPALRPFWEKKARNRVLYGGRASSKSWDASGRATYLADNARLKILCTRQFQNRIAESVYSLLKLQVDRFRLNKRFEILRDRITNVATGTEFFFYGIHHSIDEIKSLEGVDILWIEEAHNLTEEQWEILNPTIRKEHSEIWIVFNPKLATDFVYKRFVVNPPPNTLVRKINYDDNPFLSQTMLDIIEHAREEDYDEYEHIYLGVPRQDDDAVIIKRSWIMAAIDAHKALNLPVEGRHVIGFDVADGGVDKCTMLESIGPVVFWADIWKAQEDELMKSCKRVYNKALNCGAKVVYDSIGVGATVGSKFSEINEELGNNVEYEKFNAGGAVESPDDIYSGLTANKDMFLNLKAQTWWTVADRFRNTYNAIRNGQQFPDDQLISIDSSCPFLDQLIDELSTPKRDYDNNGKVKVESKKDLLKREIPSPNLADGFVMMYAPQPSPGFFG